TEPESIHRIDAPIRVVIPRGERGEAVGRQAPGPQRGQVPEKLRAVVDTPIPISVPYQKAVVWIYPTAPFLEPVAIVIEGHSILGGHRFHAIPAQIEHDRGYDLLRPDELSPNLGHSLIDPRLGD